MISQDIVNEVWRSIDGYINYQVSNIGRIRNCNNGRILKPSQRNGYLQIGLITAEGKQQHHRIHRLVAGEFLEQPDDECRKFVDHIDGNRLNNTVNNLRWATATENSRNRKKVSNPTSSKNKGVNWYADSKKWRARIQTDTQRLHIGYFDNEIDAAKAYNNKAIELFGEFASLNDLEDDASTATSSNA